MSLSFESPAFQNNHVIPKPYSCQGRDISPPLFWHNPPAATKSYALIVDDPDAPNGTWVHWVLFNLPAGIDALPENFQAGHPAVEGKNSWGTNQYRGPCPPSGTHHYFFRLFALDSYLDLSQHAVKSDVIRAMKGHILEEASLVGLYSR